MVQRFDTSGFHRIYGSDHLEIEGLVETRIQARDTLRRFAFREALQGETDADIERNVRRFALGSIRPDADECGLAFGLGLFADAVAVARGAPCGAARYFLRPPSPPAGMTRERFHKHLVEQLSGAFPAVSGSEV